MAKVFEKILMTYQKVKLVLIAFLKALNTSKGWGYEIIGSYPPFETDLTKVNICVMNGDKINPYANTMGANSILSQWQFNINVYAPINLGGVNAIDCVYSRFQTLIENKDFDYIFSCELVDETLTNQTLKLQKISLIEVFGLNQSVKIENKLIFGNQFTLILIA